MTLINEDTSQLFRPSWPSHRPNQGKSCHYQVVTLLSVIDEEPNEDIYDDIGQCFLTYGNLSVIWDSKSVIFITNIEIFVIKSTILQDNLLFNKSFQIY